MANNIDQLNYYDPLINNKPDNMSEVWISNLSAFIETLQGYLSQFGMFVPSVTTAQRDTIQSPQEGQMIYNTTTIAPQIFQNGAWKTFTTT
jgi:hypothetical protein